MKHRDRHDLIWRRAAWRKVTFAGIALLVAATAMTGAGPARGAPLSAELMLVNVQTGKCLTIAGGVSTANNVIGVQFDCDSHPSRRWTLRLKL